MADSWAGRRVRRHELSAIGQGWSLVWRADRPGFLWSVLLQLAGAGVVTAVVPIAHLAVTRTLDETGSGSASTSPSSVPVVIALAVITVCVTSTGTIQQQRQRVLAERVTTSVWQRILDITTSAPLEAFEDASFHDRLQRLQVNAVVQPITVTMSLISLIGGSVGLAGLLIVLLTLAPVLVPIILAGGLPVLLLARHISTSEYAFAVEAGTPFRRRDYLRSVLTGAADAKEVRVWGAGAALRSRHDDAGAQFLAALTRQVGLRTRYALITTAFSAVVLSVAMVTLLWLLRHGRVTLAELGAALLAIPLLSSRLDRVFRSVGSLLESASFLGELAEFEAPVQAPPTPGVGTPVAPGEIRLEGVSYRYPGSARASVEDVDLIIRPGEVVALVGENGSGKTTLAKLVAGLLPPSEGRICWSGVDVGGRSSDEITAHVAVTFQDFARYRLPALDNIGIGRPTAIDDRVAAEAAARTAMAHPFLSRLPDGFDTVLSKDFPGGTELSMGQWQRVALARALRKDAPLLILDEPASALDPRAEHELFDDVRQLLQGRSALLITQRFSSVRLADRIYVLRDGRIAESGSHADLLDRRGVYAELFSLQARAYA